MEQSVNVGERVIRKRTFFLSFAHFGRVSCLYHDVHFILISHIFAIVITDFSAQRLIVQFYPSGGPWLHGGRNGLVFALAARRRASSGGSVGTGTATGGGSGGGGGSVSSSHGWDLIRAERNDP